MATGNRSRRGAQRNRRSPRWSRGKARSEAPKEAPDLDQTKILPRTGPVDITRSLADDATLAARIAGSPAIGGEQGRVPAMGVWAHLELIEKVGEGGFGETFRARDTHLDREVALKLLKVELSQQEALGGQVISEGALLARVRHPNVVTVYAAQRHEGRVGLWMEYIHGRTLESQLMEQGALGEREAALVGVDLCRALSPCTARASSTGTSRPAT